MNNWLTCVQCGRSTYSRNPEVVDELGRGSIKLICPCGRTDSWLWCRNKPEVQDLPELRDAWRRLRPQTLPGPAFAGPSSQTSSPVLTTAVGFSGEQSSES